MCRQISLREEPQEGEGEKTKKELCLCYALQLLGASGEGPNYSNMVKVCWFAFYIFQQLKKRKKEDAVHFRVGFLIFFQKYLFFTNICRCRLLKTYRIMEPFKKESRYYVVRCDSCTSEL